MLPLAQQEPPEKPFALRAGLFDEKKPPPKDPAAGEENKEQAQEELLGWPLGIPLSAKERLAMSVASDLAVLLSRKAFEQLFAWAYATASEISCLGVVRREGNLLVVERFHLVKQTGSAAHTEMDADALATLVEELLAQGKAEEARSLRCWAHSHPGMKTFWSGTDQETVQRLAADWLVRLVISDDFAIRARLDTRLPVPLTVDQAPVYVAWGMADDRKESLAREVADKVRPAALPQRVLVQRNDHQPAYEGEGGHFCAACGNGHERGECPFAGGYFQGLDDADLDAGLPSALADDDGWGWGI